MKDRKTAADRVYETLVHDGWTEAEAAYVAERERGSLTYALANLRGALRDLWIGIVGTFSRGPSVMPVKTESGVVVGSVDAVRRTEKGVEVDMTIRDEETIKMLSDDVRYYSIPEDE